jgi:hypothetical protein
MYTYAVIENKNNPQHTMAGHIIWRDQECFGLEISVYGGYSTVVCYYDEWDISYPQDAYI